MVRASGWLRVHDARQNAEASWKVRQQPRKSWAGGSFDVPCLQPFLSALLISLAMLHALRNWRISSHFRNAPQVGVGQGVASHEKLPMAEAGRCRDDLRRAHESEVQGVEEQNHIPAACRGRSDWRRVLIYQYWHSCGCAFRQPVLQASRGFE